ncbi:MAG: hypothetical protein HF311_06935 [Ignavibacteria bacterium]|jgi:DNA polymerase III alpha subunit|nr:hypothetical protein [Ignavibacteria bacterium]
MKITNSETAYIDLKSYTLPETRFSRGKLRQIYTPVPRKTARVKFDIYDYKMLFNDEGVKKLIREGNTIGCFYIESPGMRSLLKKLSVDTFEMLTAASSIIRPGVAESGMMQEFILRHKDPSKRKYLLPQMKEYLSETYGIMIYQEDVLKVAHHIAGLSLEEADILRRAMSGKMRSRSAMEQLEEKFFTSCKSKGISEAAARELWRQIESFAGYAFCKAHSASFALLSFQVAFLKVYYPAEFMASVLSNGGGFYSAAVYIQECKRMGLKVLLPCVNNSERDYTGKDKEVRIGLMAIKNLSVPTMSEIVKERNRNGEYVSLSDFLSRTSVGYEETSLLIRCGAMDCFKKTRPTLMRLLDVYMSYRKTLSMSSLFAGETLKLESEVITDVSYTVEEACAIEYETFGYMVSRHPLEFFSELLGGPSIIRAEDMDNLKGRRVKMGGWYMSSKRIRTRKGEIMKFLSLEDLTGTFEAILFPETYNRYAELTLSMGPYLIEGKIDPGDGRNIIVDRLEVATSARIKSITQKEGSEGDYFGDVEKIMPEEFEIFTAEEHERLRQAYM